MRSNGYKHQCVIKFEYLEGIKVSYTTVREEIPSGGLRWYLPADQVMGQVPVFFAPGSFALSGPYNWIGEALVEIGYTVGMISLGIYDVVTSWEEGISDAKNFAHRRFGSKTYRIIGHSLGANGALVYAGPDSDCTGIVALCPAYATKTGNVHKSLMNNACLNEDYRSSTLFIAGGVDTISPVEGVQTHYKNLLSLAIDNQAPSAKFVTIDGAGHAQFMNTLMASFYQLLLDDVDPTISTRTVHEIVIKEVLDWFKPGP